MITLEATKLHLRVDHDDENAAILDMLTASTAAALDYLNLDAFGTMPAPVQAAILLQVGDLYANRERQADKQYFANATYERLLNPYRAMDVLKQHWQTNEPENVNGT